ncbi:hypothetical protein QQ045_011040 [Rhodiola kirilowii]
MAISIRSRVKQELSLSSDFIINPSALPSINMAGNHINGHISNWSYAPRTIHVGRSSFNMPSSNMAGNHINGHINKRSYAPGLRRIREILSIYERSSGLRVNYEKSEIMVSKNIQPDMIVHIQQILGVNIVSSHSKYLGLPTVLLRSQVQTFQGILDKLWSKTSSWKSLTLSQGGKEVLVQAVLNAIPQYWLSCFLLPAKVVNKIHLLINKFWWSHFGRKAGVHWINADKLRMPEEEGGLGFYNFKHLNLAYLTKQLWRLAKNPDLLATRLLKAKYNSNCHILEAQLTSKPSHVWRAMYTALPMLKYGCQRDHNTWDLQWRFHPSGILDLKSVYKNLHLVFQDDGYQNRGEQV